MTMLLRSARFQLCIGAVLETAFVGANRVVTAGAPGVVQEDPCHCHCPACPDPNWEEPPDCPPATEPPPPPMAERPTMPPPDELAPLPKVPAGDYDAFVQVHVHEDRKRVRFLAPPLEPKECICDCPPCDYWQPKLPACTYNNERVCNMPDISGNPEIKHYTCFVPPSADNWGKEPEPAPVTAVAPTDPCDGDPALLPGAAVPPPVENSAPTLPIPENEPPQIGEQFKPVLAPLP
ncbi:unnamed protein product [Amoebophrya sp. A25]|nr:unnamed protein product [Amoebophrya sp. A25]|eukprot:GSA25T00013549001.1